MITPATATPRASTPAENHANALNRHLAVSVLVIGLSVTALAWWKTASRERSHVEQVFATETQTLRDRLRERLQEHELKLRGTLGMIAASGRTPTRHEWQLYVNSLNLSLDGSGILGIGLVLSSSPKNLQAFSDALLQRAPATDKTADRPDLRQLQTAVAHVEPLDDATQHLLGRDLSADPVALAAMQIARDTGHAAVSGQLGPELNPQSRGNFTIFVPLYAPDRDIHSLADRRTGLLGYAFSPMQAEDLISSVLKTTAGAQPYFNLKVFDAGGGLLFNTRHQHGAPALVTEHALELPGRTWTLRFDSSPAFEAAHRSHVPHLVAGGGFLLSLLIFGLMWTVSRQRDWAETQAREMTRELRENRTMLEAITESAHDAILSIGPDGRITYLNPAALRMFALAPGTGPGLLLDNLILTAQDKTIMNAGTAPDCITEGTGRRRDGSTFPIELSVAVWATTGGATLNAIVRDISERKFAERRMEVENAIARVLSESRSVDEAISVVIRMLATTYGWDCGAFWQISDDGLMLRCVTSWTGDDPALNAFYAEATDMPVHSAGNGIARQAWKTDAPYWIPDVQSCGTLRAGGFARSAIKSGTAFPVNAGKEKIGVIELFSRQSLQPKESLLSALASFGLQIAQFCKRKQAEHDLWKTATHDALTGLPNRSMFNESLLRAFARARRQQGRIAVMFVDLDRFKTINDTLGHEAGDAMLVGIAQRLRKVTREVDLVARLGGDEFVLLIEHFNNNDDLGHVASRILEELDAPINCVGHPLHATASIGISISPDDGEDAPALLKGADIAMYRAKEEGRNQFRFYSTAMSAHSVEHLNLENALREAITREEFLLHYQPKADLSDGRIVGVEALIRWMNPARGMVPPGNFIPLAEESGLILPIGRWALQTACRQGRAWQLEGLPHLRIAVNLSAYQLTPDLPSEVAAALAAAELDAQWLEIEVTESMMMRNPEQSAQILDALRALGVHISMDDFGCGHSSLGALKRLPLDTLKVDRSLVSDLPDDAGDNAICRAIVAMAHALRLRVVAEGVETEAQREFLRGINCDEIQGYLLSRPLSAIDAAAFIRAADTSRLRLVHSR